MASRGHLWNRAEKEMVVSGDLDVIFMGQKHFSNFVFPSKCRGSNTFLHPNNLPLLVDTPDLHKIHQVDICFKEIPSYRHQPDVKELTFLTYNIWF